MSLKYDAAEILHISSVTVTNWVKAGRLKLLKEKEATSPKTQLFERSVLEEWINANVDVGEACELLGVTKREFGYWIAKGWIRVTVSAPGMAVQYSRADFLRSNEHPP